MATTFIDYTGDGNATKSFSFPSIQESDVKVEVDTVLKSSGTHYNITGYTTTGGGNVVFTSGNIPSSPAAIRIFRDTDVDSAKATYTAGSSVKAADLNANHEQLLFAAQEEQNQTVITSDIKDGAVTSAKIKAGTIVNADINASAAIEGSKIQASSGSVAGTMSSANFTKLAGIETGATADQTNAEIRAAVEAASDSNVFTDADHSKLNGIESGATADQTNAEIRAAVEAATDSNVFTDADHSKLNAIEAGATADQTVTEIKSLIAGSPLDASHLAANSVTTSEIADAELTTLAGMQSGTASKLADSTALTADIADLNQIDGMQKATTITDDDTKFPTSGAVVDYVAAQLEPFGGFEAIADEVSFPNTQPAAGVAISIADAAGIVVNSSGTSTTGRTVGGTTVTINNINSQYNSSTVASGIRFIVTSTGSGQVYNYHKSTLPESDLVNLSGDINDFNERYRVGGSNPTTSLDAGDLFFNTGTNQLLVYNATSAAWEETQTVGNFFINTISSSSATGGGSATANGTAYRFTLSNAGTFAQQHLVSVDGVIQKPNSGTSQPSEGFAVDGSDIIFGSAPVNGASLFVITIGAAVSIGTPSNNTVSTAVLQNGAVNTAKLAADAVDGTKIADDAIDSEHIAADSIDSEHYAAGSVDTTAIADQAVTLDKLPHGTSSNNGKFLRANNGADPSFETVSAAAGNLNAIQTTDGSGNFTASNTFTINGDSLIGHDISLNSDSSNNPPVLAVGNGHGGTVRVAITQAGAFGSILDTSGLQLGRNTQYVKLAAPADQSGQTSYTLTFPPTAGSNGQALTTNGSGTTSWTTISSDLVADTSPQLGGSLDVNGNNISFVDSTGTNNNRATFGASNDMAIYHDGSNSRIKETGTGHLILSSNGNGVLVQSDNGQNLAKFLTGGASELYYNYSKKLETTADGVILNGAADISHSSADNLQVGTGSGSNGVTIYSGSDSNGSFYFADGSSGNAAYRGFIEYSHSSDFMSFGSGGVTAAYFDNSGHFLPISNNSKNLGSTSKRWANVYTNDLHLSNVGHTNDVDGTWGDWTIQEGESDLFLKNNRSGKKYKFNLTEVS